VAVSVCDDLVVITEIEDDLIKRLNECKYNIENRGIRENMNKTSIMIIGECQKLMQKSLCIMYFYVMLF